ncbi:MAG: ParB/RepB/Spo0J family partition protein, partial [Candidatus Roizmanbacteria bacterium]
IHFFIYYNRFMVNDGIEDIRDQDDPIVKARLMADAISKKEATPTALAKYLKVKKSFISSMLRIPRIPEMIIDGYYANLISVTHLFIIGRLSSDEEMITLYEKILEKSLTTVQTDDEVRTIKYAIDSNKDIIDPVSKGKIEQLFSGIDPHFRVKIIQTRLRTTIKAELKGDMKTTAKALRKLAEMVKDPEGNIVEM